jgi:hypothetical protein
MKTILSLLSILLFSNISTAQSTVIPDPNFEQALINLGLDTAIDGQVLTASINSVQTLIVNSENINSLIGIQYFSALTDLRCSNNQLASLDLTQNTALYTLFCNGNQLTTLDLSQNIVLRNLYCFQNQLTSLNVSQNTALEILSFSNNQLNSIDVSQNTALTFFSGFQNQLTSLDVSQNAVLTNLWSEDNQLTCLNVKNGNNLNINNFYAGNNSNLICIEVDDVAYSTTNWTDIDVQTAYSTNCGNPCSIATGIEENSLSNLSLYPNPTMGNINVVLGKVKQDIKTTLTNSLSQVILFKNYTSTNFINLDMDAPKGIYFLQLEVDGQVITKKIIKE